MKKIIAIALALVMLCGAVTALADTGLVTPSKTTEDLVTFEVTVEHPVEGKTVVIMPINEQTVDDVTKYQANLDTADDELEKAQTAKTVEAYFDEETSKAVAAILGENAVVSMDELFAILQSGYEEGMGDATVAAEVATPYAKGEKAAALIGIVKDDVVTWHVYEAVGLEDGRLQFTVDAMTMLEINPNITLFAVCSK